MGKTELLWAALVDKIAMAIASDESQSMTPHRFNLHFEEQKTVRVAGKRMMAAHLEARNTEYYDQAPAYRRTWDADRANVRKNTIELMLKTALLHDQELAKWLERVPVTLPASQTENEKTRRSVELLRFDLARQNMTGTALVDQLIEWATSEDDRQYAVEFGPGIVEDIRTNPKHFRDNATDMDLLERAVLARELGNIGGGTTKKLAQWMHAEHNAVVEQLLAGGRDPEDGVFEQLTMGRHSDLGMAPDGVPIETDSAEHVAWVRERSEAYARSHVALGNAFITDASGGATEIEGSFSGEEVVVGASDVTDAMQGLELDGGATVVE